jgi:hypothetical protein
MACAFRTAGIPVTIEGAERVHCTIDAPDRSDVVYTLLNQLRAKHQTTFGIGHRDIIGGSQIIS